MERWHQNTGYAPNDAMTASEYVSHLAGIPWMYHTYRPQPETAYAYDSADDSSPSTAAAYARTAQPVYKTFSYLPEPDEEQRQPVQQYAISNSPALQSQPITTMASPAFQPRPVITMTMPAYQSQQGKYFLGESGPLSGKQAWAALVNPRNSGVRLFLNIMTFSNGSDQPVRAAVIFHNGILAGGRVSEDVSSTNLSLSPLPRPQGQIQYYTASPKAPSGGTKVTSRIVPPHCTLLTEKTGEWILGPGTSLVVFLEHPGLLNGSIAFGWWERR